METTENVFPIRLLLKRSWRYLGVILLMTICFETVYAQSFTGRKLFTEKDGYQWYLYRYQDKNGHTISAAVDLYGNRLTPYCTFDRSIRYNDSTACFEYSGKLLDNETNERRSVLIGKYDKNGNCVFSHEYEFPDTTIYQPREQRIYTRNDGTQAYSDYFYYIDKNGYLYKAVYDINGNRITPYFPSNCWLVYKKGHLYECSVYKNDDGSKYIEKHKDGTTFINKKHLNKNKLKETGWELIDFKDDERESLILGIFDKNGNCIVSGDYGFNYAYYYPEEGLIQCKKANKRSKYLKGTGMTFTMDGMYCANGQLSGQEFNMQKRLVKPAVVIVNAPDYSVNGASSIIRDAEWNLLYRGEYTVSEDVGSTIEMISIYEDRVNAGGTAFAYKSTNASGERVYAGDGAFGVFWRFYVSPNYNIRIIKEYPNPYTGIPTTVNCRVTKGISSTPIQNGGGYDDGGGNITNPNSSSGNPVQPHQVTKDCPLCHGSGKCSTCNGTHRIDYQFGAGTLECPNCKPDGHCTYCGGTGKVTSTKYY